MLIVLTLNSAYRVTFPASGAVIRAVKISGHRPSTALDVGESVVGEILTLGIGRPMLLGSLRTSTVVAIMNDPEDRP